MWVWLLQTLGTAFLSLQKSSICILKGDIRKPRCTVIFRESYLTLQSACFHRNEWLPLMLLIIQEYGDPWWNDTDRRKPNNSAKNLSQHPFVQHKSHMNWSGREPEPSRLECQTPIRGVAWPLLETWSRTSFDRVTIYFKFQNNRLQHGIDTVNVKVMLMLMSCYGLLFWYLYQLFILSTELFVKYLVTLNQKII
jgi:hypothetical protein